MRSRRCSACAYRCTFCVGERFTLGIVRFLRSKGISLEHWQIIAIFLVLCDAVAISAAYLGALFLRFDGVFSQIPQHFLRGTMRVILPYIMLCVVCFWKGKMYQDMWRFSSFCSFWPRGFPIACFNTSVPFTRFIIPVPVASCSSVPAPRGR